MRAGMEYFRNFERDAADFTRMAQTRLTMPVRVIAGEKSGGSFLIDQVRLVAQDVEGTVIEGSGHWLMEEAPEKVIPVLQQYVH
jgi:pimeloyl-ACP methyl ester carboxylesterase